MRRPRRRRPLIGDVAARQSSACRRMRQTALSRQGAVRCADGMARVGDELQVFVGPGAAHAEARPEAGKRCVSVFRRVAAGRGWCTRMDRLASRSFKDLNSGALRRKQTGPCPN